jgi:hypothetical protein
VSHVALVRRDQGLDGITNDGRDWPPRVVRPLPQRPGLVIRELNLHTLHMQNDSVYVNYATDGPP